MNNSVQFTCKCGESRGFVEEDKKTNPCPSCGRVYVGEYNYKELGIIVKEVKA